MNLLLLLAALAAAPAPLPAEMDSDEACPAPVMSVPRYPAEELRNNIGGMALVMATVDACGRILSPRISATSGHDALDEAALTTVRTWVLNPAQRAIAKGGVIKLPVKFGGLQGSPKQTYAIPWPESHRSPQYRADDMPFGFDSIKQFMGDESFGASGVYKSPYDGIDDGMDGRVSTYFFHDARKPDTFWLTYWRPTKPTSMVPGASRVGAKTVAVARYRLVAEDDKPVARIALLCEARQDDCSALQAFLLKGLPIAPPPRR